MCNLHHTACRIRDHSPDHVKSGQKPNLINYTYTATSADIHYAAHVRSGDECAYKDIPGMGNGGGRMRQVTVVDAFSSPLSPLSQMIIHSPFVPQ